ncbi:transglutaminase TgpA family protein [Fictibacillus sp. NRS-1165]|uniref:transglutaminase TgpA family protein n=1 Tax=Fictibacillus sp. NRS-1165 TaxID=3144463 RepID=UPI003D22227F
MQPFNENRPPSVYSLVLYALGFMLLWEWLRPLTQITSTEDTQIFVVFTAFLFIVAYFRLPFWISFAIKLIALLYAVHALYYPDVFLSFQWVPHLIGDLQSSLALIWDQQWTEMSSLSRSLLFFILLWLVSYLMHYWLIQAKRIFLFLFITVLYITVLDTFTPYDAKMAIVRTVFIGLILVGILRIMKIVEAEGFSLMKGRFPVMWMVPLTVVIALSSTLGLLAPKASPQWPDPVPFITSMSDKGEEGAGINTRFARIGYGTNDSRLGGPFKFDYKEVFTATVKERHYWRVETKDAYTGKGWENSFSNEQLLLDRRSVEYAAPGSSLIEQGGAQMVKEEASINMAKTYPFIVSPGVITSIQAKKNVDFMLDPLTGQINTTNGGNPTRLKQYKLEYELPLYDKKKLRESSQSYPQYVTQYYLQLPAELPQRVKKLAARIVKNEDNPYDKAKAVENYFSLNNFGYDTVDVRVPKKNEDYVDKFLFDAQKGYCDNFSTSMIVLLRSVGIPARWVKGFTYGEYQDTKNVYKTYKITNANAHSWPEVYFAGVGWVPFEPTRGFSNPTPIEEEMKSASAPVAPPVKKNDKKQVQPDKKEQSASKGQNGDGTLAIIGTALLYVIPLTVAAALLALLFRKKWLRQYYIWKFRRRNGSGTFADAYDRLLWLTQLYGLKKDPSYTLREYAVYVDRSLDTRDMRRLTSAYESLQYSNKQMADPWTETNKELWENLIKKLRG